MQNLASVALLLFSIMFSQTMAAGQGNNPSNFSTLDQQAQRITQQVIELNRDLLVLQEELVFPENSQVAVFLSVDVGAFFNLDAVQVKIDDKVIANHLYDKKEVDALHRGGVQRLFLGNMKVGRHALAVFFTGKGPRDRPYLRGANINFEKSDKAKYLELVITDVARKKQPEFIIKQW